MRFRLQRFGRDQGGGMAAPLALALPVLFGFAMLAIDGSRYFNLQTSVQAGADALALAGAAELDGRPDAFARANRAIATLTKNDPRFGKDVTPIAGVEVTFLKSLPTQESQPVGAANVTSDPAEARFVQVAARAVGFTGLFMGAARATSSNIEGTSARAVAGFESLACKASPLFICNPYEGTGTDLFTAMNNPTTGSVNRRRLIAMKEKSSKYFPGNFGYLQPAYGNGAADLRDAMANAEPLGCYKQSGVELRTGAVSSTAEAMNTRFDLYDGPFKGESANPSYRPALNVRKGFVRTKNGSDQCNPTLAYDPAIAPDKQGLGKDVLESLGMPRDGCFYKNNGCSFGGASMDGRVGDGTWDFERYWTVTYGSKPKPNGWSKSNLPSRYDVYRYEIEQGLVNDESKGLNGDPKLIETGTPQCFPSNKMPTKTDETVDRRIFYGAILDCKRLDDLYGMSGGSAPPVPVTAFGKFFITEPIDKNDGTIWVELTDIVEPGTSSARGIVQDVIKLFR